VGITAGGVGGGGGGGGGQLLFGETRSKMAHALDVVPVVRRVVSGQLTAHELCGCADDVATAIAAAAVRCARAVALGWVV
jgi:hypothetical protein